MTEALQYSLNLGKLIQDIYQYNYYVKINDVEVTPYPKDKKILITKLGLRLYARTEPDEQVIETSPLNKLEQKDKKDKK